MSDQIPFQFPAQLASARRTAGKTQKALAAASSLNQSVLCAIEKGRRRGPGRETVSRLVEGLALEEPATDELQWAAAHDRVLELVLAELPSAAGIVSLALRLDRMLGTEEQAGCETFLKELLGSKTVLARISAKRDPAKEAPMD